MARSGERNKIVIYYALYLGKVETVDDDGYKTGMFAPVYSTPVKKRMCVSPARGSNDVELFGANTNYTNVIATTDMHCPIDENSVLWIWRGVDQPHNYIVTRVARSINSILYAVREVDVNNG